MLWIVSALADTPVTFGTPTVERSLLEAVSIRWPLSIADDVPVSIRYRPSGGSTWSDALPLHAVKGPGAAEYAGMVFDLAPGRRWEIELSTELPQLGAFRSTFEAETRPEPSDPPDLKVVRVQGDLQLHAALEIAGPGMAIELAGGTYHGPFTLGPSGKPDEPIVIRGAPGEDAVVTAFCAACAALTVFGSNVHVESLTLRSAPVGLAFDGLQATDDVATGLTIRDVQSGIRSGPNAHGLVVCDSTLVGRVDWPSDPDVSNPFVASDGISLGGEGHTICHDSVRGFARGLVLQPGTRDSEVFGNEVRDSADAAIALDGVDGNALVAFDRVTDAGDGISLAPVLGGPVYVVRNLVYNVAREQLRFQAGGAFDVEPSGLEVYRNTFVTSGRALTLLGSGTGHDFRIEGNLFVGSGESEATLEWSAGIDGGGFDCDGWYPDARFVWDALGQWADLEDLAAHGPFEQRGIALDGPPLAAGGPPDDPTAAAEPISPALRPDSVAVDAADPIPGLDDAYQGAGPDLGAHELGCRIYPYGPLASGACWLPNDCGPSPDSDGDGLPDDIELQIGTDPHDADTDGDGLTDGAEGVVDHDGDGSLDPLDPDDDGDGLATIDEGYDDFDGDGSPNYLDLDSDGDGAADASEGLPNALDPGLGGRGSPPAPPRGCDSGGGAGPWWLVALALRRRIARRPTSPDRIATATASGIVSTRSFS